MSDVAVPPAAGSPVGAAATGVGERRGLHPARHTGRSARMIGEVVMDLGFADQDGVDRAIELARQSRRPTGQVLVEQGVHDHDQLPRVVAERFCLDYIALSMFELAMGDGNRQTLWAVSRDY